ncbi:MAG: type II toxin-antitoxin system VapC family toxin [Gammaproteobacteria bacterium]|nr:MAG: type II toxin-antitoxin system VapC family toxin [Gammaproteobacteria bacterium]
MPPRVYLETSLVSYAVGRRSRDLITLANQELTREWWETERQNYELFISELVLREVEVGDPDMAQRRLVLLASLPLLSIPEEAELLAPVLLRVAGLSENAATDALHMALAAVHGMQYLLTWNCKHIANAVTRRAVERQCSAAGYDPPVICTPQELMAR